MRDKNSIPTITVFPYVLINIHIHRLWLKISLTHVTLPTICGKIASNENQSNNNEYTPFPRRDDT